MGANFNQMGDYMQMAAEGDRVVAAFPDTRLGDPDVYVDASLHVAVASCPGMASAFTDQDTTLELRLSNQGNYGRELDWRVEDTAGWLSAAVPGLAGSATLAVGETLVVQATLRLASCSGDSTVLSFIHSDPAIPGWEDTCATLFRCTKAGGFTPVTVSLVSSDAEAGLVRLTWYAPWPTLQATVERRVEGAAWTKLGSPTMDGGYLSYEDRDPSLRGRYAYHLELETAAGHMTTPETWVDVPTAVPFALERIEPNPTRDVWVVRFSVPSSGQVRLEVFDILGRRMMSRDLAALGAGRHQVRLDEVGSLSDGAYLLRLTADGQTASRFAVRVR